MPSLNFHPCGLLIPLRYFGTKKVELKRKPIGRDCDGGREILILDENGNQRFRHRSKYDLSST